jgi:hypothetical protein
MTDNDVRVLGSRLDQLETKIDTKFEVVVRLEEGVKHIVEALKGCPMCQSAIATHTANFADIQRQLEAQSKSIELLWSRIWWGAGIVIVAVAGAIIQQAFK